MSNSSSIENSATTIIAMNRSPALEMIAGRYRFIRKIGSGAFGTVVEAWDTRLERRVAIKQLRNLEVSTAQQKQRFVREGRILAKLDHRNIVPIFDAELERDHPFIVMKMIDGDSLDDVLKPKPLGEVPALKILQQVVEGLSHAHSESILHRDLKPSNILLEPSNRVYLVDFGLAAASFASRITNPDTIVGTMHYLSPEAIRGKHSEQSDLYAVGAVYYKMVFGETLFHARDVAEIAYKIASETPRCLVDPPVEVSDESMGLLNYLLNKNTSLRPKGTREVSEIIVTMLAGQSDQEPAVASSAELDPQLDALAQTADEIATIRDGHLDEDRLAVLLSEFTAKGIDMLRQIEGDPDHAARYSIPLQGYAESIENRLEGLAGAKSSHLGGLMLKLHRQLLNPTATLIGQIQQQKLEQTAPATFFTFEDQQVSSDGVLEDGSDWIEDLFSDDVLNQYDAALRIVGEGRESFLSRLNSSAEAERDRLLDAAWRHADVLLLEGRSKSKLIFDCILALSANEEIIKKWRLLYTLFRKYAGDDYMDPDMVRLGLGCYEEEDRRVFGRSLLIHPSATYRSLALNFLEPSDFWGVITNEDTSIEWLLTIWRHLRHRVEDDFFKIFFVCIKDRLLAFEGVDESQVSSAIELAKEFYDVHCFHENSFFEILRNLEDRIIENAQRRGLTVSFDEIFKLRMEEFLSAGVAPDQPISNWRNVPLPIQRKMARAGYRQFMPFFVCHPKDVIALECLPHLLITENIMMYLELNAINRRLIEELCKEDRLYRDERAKYLLVANPKTPHRVITKYVGLLRTDLLKKIANSRDCGTFAKNYALKYLKTRGQA